MLDDLPCLTIKEEEEEGEEEAAAEEGLVWHRREVLYRCYKCATRR